jgi:hypothetical protein
MKFEEKIKYLISLKKEGSFWDFKVEPHSNKINLLHDIVSMANVIHDSDRYIIIGVSNSTYKIKGLQKGQKNRKEQSHLIDFIREKNFGGIYKPETEIRTLEIDQKEIDIIVIKNNPYKPYYLTEDYSFERKKIRANYVYTRNLDTNTPIDKSANFIQIEQMWKERFGLNLSPVSKMEELLKEPENWFKDLGNKKYAYHKTFAEYNIEFSETEEFWETWSYFFLNHKSFCGTATFKYHSTILFELEYMFCDEFRIESSVPTKERVKVGEEDNWYYYFNLNERNGLFQIFLSDNFKYESSKGQSNPFITFKNDSEKMKFNQHLNTNAKNFNELEHNYGKRVKEIMDQHNRSTQIDPIFVGKIINQYQKWKGYA